MEKWRRSSRSILSAVTRSNAEYVWFKCSKSYRSEDNLFFEFVPQVGTDSRRVPQFSMRPMNRRHPFQSACNSFWFSHFSPISEIEGLYDSQARSYGTAAMKIQRNPSFSKIEVRDILHFQNILGEKNVIQDKDELAAANLDWMGKYGGSSELLLRPRNTEEVSQILKYCDSRCLAVVPQGGNTGLVGGSVPVFDEVIVNLGLMNNIISCDKVSGILVCEAGCILENLDIFLADQGYMMPIDLGAKGSCQIGGNISTNAGGIRLFRYGSLRGNVLGEDILYLQARLSYFRK